MPKSVVPFLGSPMPSYEQILVNNDLRALWHQESGVVHSAGALTSWTDRVGNRVITPSGAGCTFAADGSLYQGKSVINIASNRTVRNATQFNIVDSVVDVGATPYLFFIWRYKSNGGAYPYGFTIDRDDAQEIVLFTGEVGVGGLNVQFKIPTPKYAEPAPTSNTNVHVTEAWINGTQAVSVHDGVTVTKTASGVMAADLLRVTLGGAQIAMSYFLFGICNDVPDAATRALVRARMNMEVL